MVDSIILTVMEVIGTVSFSVSGSLIAISSGLDLFGVVFVGCITAVGGGIIRDILLGNNPPLIFLNIEILCVSIITSLIVFLIACFNTKKFTEFQEKIESINNLFDALGLSAFSIMGTEFVCMSVGYKNVFFAVAMGMITGVGGGIIRDILVDKTPYVLKKHIYALASIFGSSVYYFIRTYSNYQMFGTFASMAIIVLIRVLATKYLWQLPKIKMNISEVNEKW